jgi:hypothetical protein
VVLADAGYWHQKQLERTIAQGIQVLISPDTSKRKTPRPGWTGGHYAFMRRVLASERGGALYRQRPMIEPVFGHTTQPRPGPIPPPRQRRRQSRMATHHGHAQPAQASRPPARGRLSSRFGPHAVAPHEH